LTDPDQLAIEVGERHLGPQHVLLAAPRLQADPGELEDVGRETCGFSTRIASARSLYERS